MSAREDMLATTSVVIRAECRSIRQSSAECPHEVFKQLFAGVEIPVDSVLDEISEELRCLYATPSR